MSGTVAAARMQQDGRSAEGAAPARFPSPAARFVMQLFPVMPSRAAEGPARRSLRGMMTIDRLPRPAARLLHALPFSAEPRMRHAFGRFHDRVNHLAMRWGIYTGAVLWALAGLLGWATRPWNAQGLAQNLGMVLPFYLAAGVAMGNPRFRGHYQWLAALCNLSSGLLVFAVAPRLPEPGLTMLVGLVIITFHAVLGLRLRVQYAVPVMLLYNGIYLALLWTVEQPPIESAIVRTFLIGMATLGAAAAAVVLEANLWTLFRSRSVQRARHLRPDHRMSALPEDLGRRWHERPGLVMDRPGHLSVLSAAVELEPRQGGGLDQRVSALHHLLVRFDALAHRRGLERVHMGANGFVAASSAARPGAAGGHDLAELALTMLHLAEEAELPDGITASLRIGIDQGPALRAALGTAMPAFDVIGAAADGAASLRDIAPANCILVSERFQHSVMERFETQECGTVPGTAERAFLLWGVKAWRERGALQVLRSVSRSAFALACIALVPPARAQWARIEALPASDTPSLLVQEGMLYAGTDSTVWRSADGMVWERGATLPSPGYFVDALFHDGSTLFAGTGGDGLYVSPTEGSSWQSFSQGLTGIGSDYIADVAVFDEALWCATVGGGVFRRSGAAWEAFGGLDGMNAGNVAMLRAIGDTLWAGAGGNGLLWRTMPGMDGFEAVQVAPVEWEMHAITDLVRSGGTLLAGGTYGIYRSLDGGDTWAWSSTGLPGGGNVRFLATADALYALRSTASSRLYRSVDQGASWQLVEPLPFCYAIAAYAGRLYAARTDGLWVRDLPVSTGEAAALPDRALGLFPNPAHDAVRVHLGHEGGAELELLDADGRVMRSMRALQQELTLDVSGYAPGAYIVRANHGGTTQTGRLLVR